MPLSTGAEGRVTLYTLLWELNKRERDEIGNDSVTKKEPMDSQDRPPPLSSICLLFIEKNWAPRPS